MSGTMTEMAYQPIPQPVLQPPLQSALQPEAFDWDDYYAHVVTEDDEPVDNLFSAKQQTLLKRALYASWTPPAREGQTARSFLADVNVGIFGAPGVPPIVPDFFLSLDVKPHPLLREKRHRSYFIREFGKPPDVAVEIVSNKEGGELGSKLERYAELGVRYYVVFDPLCELSRETLQLFELADGVYQRRGDLTLPEIGLGLALWEGDYEGFHEVWLRWTTPAQGLLPLGQERAVEAEGRAAQAEGRVAREAAARRHAETQAARLAAQLRALGIEPE